MSCGASKSIGTRSENTARSRVADDVTNPKSVLNAIQPSSNGEKQQPRVRVQASQDPRQPAASQAGQNRGGNSQTQNFVSKLHYLLEHDCPQEVISWDRNGRSFTIHNRQRFEQEILSVHFKASKLTSFYRQLNLYNFNRPTNKQLTFYHLDFFRGPEVAFATFRPQRIKGTRFRQQYQGLKSEEIAALPPASITSSSNDSQIEKDDDTKIQSKRVSQSDANDQGNQSSKKLKANPTAPHVNVTIVQGGGAVINNYYYGNKSPQQDRVTSNSSDFIVDHKLIRNEDADFQSFLDDFLSDRVEPISTGGDDKAIEASHVDSLAYNQAEAEADPLFCLTELSVQAEENPWYSEK